MNIILLTVSPFSVNLLVAALVIQSLSLSQPVTSQVKHKQIIMNNYIHVTMSVKSVSQSVSQSIKSVS